MEDFELTRSGRKHRAILEAATTVFLSKGYQGTSMDEIAALAEVSKQTVYKHFADKERLFTEIVMATTDQVEEIIRFVAGAAGGATDVETLDAELTELATRFLTTLMQPRLIQLRRLVVASADRFPELGRLWYERGFERVLVTLGDSFRRLADVGLLEMDDPLLAAHHFAGLLLWLPMNRVMFSPAEEPPGPPELDRYARAAVRAFISAYHPAMAAAPASP